MQRAPVKGVGMQRLNGAVKTDLLAHPIRFAEFGNSLKRNCKRMFEQYSVAHFSSCLCAAAICLVGDAHKSYKFGMPTPCVSHIELCGLSTYSVADQKFAFYKKSTLMHSAFIPDPAS